MSDTRVKKRIISATDKCSQILTRNEFACIACIRCLHKELLILKFKVYILQIRREALQNSIKEH